MGHVASLGRACGRGHSSSPSVRMSASSFSGASTVDDRLRRGSDRRARRVVLNGQPSPFHTQIAWIGLATYPGLPSVSVPVGGHEGLPIGIQVIAPHWQDHTAVALSGEIAKLCGTQ